MSHDSMPFFTFFFENNRRHPRHSTDTQGQLMSILAIASFTSSVMTHKSVPLYVRYSAQEWAPQRIVDAFLTPQWVQPNSQEHSIMLEYVFFSWLLSRAWRTHYGLLGFLGTLNEEWMDGWKWPCLLRPMFHFSWLGLIMFSSSVTNRYRQYGWPQRI